MILYNGEIKKRKCWEEMKIEIIPHEPLQKIEIPHVPSL